MIIGLRGTIGAGKTTVAKKLVSRLNDLGYCFKLRSFASPIKDGLRIMGVTKEEHPGLYRVMAQAIGTDHCRNYDPDWWVKQAQEYINLNKFVIFDDVRFPNETKILDCLIHLKRYNSIPNNILSHPSEKMNLEFSTDNSLGFTVDNNGDIDVTVNKIIQYLIDNHNLNPIEQLIEDDGA